MRSYVSAGRYSKLENLNEAEIAFLSMRLDNYKMYLCKSNKTNHTGKSNLFVVQARLADDATVVVFQFRSQAASQFPNKPTFTEHFSTRHDTPYDKKRIEARKQTTRGGARAI